MALLAKTWCVTRGACIAFVTQSGEADAACGWLLGLAVSAANESTPDKKPNKSLPMVALEKIRMA
jgi:hypothetical protein